MKNGGRLLLLFVFYIFAVSFQGSKSPIEGFKGKLKKIKNYLDSKEIVINDTCEISISFFNKDFWVNRCSSCSGFGGHFSVKNDSIKFKCENIGVKPGCCEVCPEAGTLLKNFPLITNFTLSGDTLILKSAKQFKLLFVKEL